MPTGRPPGGRAAARPQSNRATRRGGLTTEPPPGSKAPCGAQDRDHGMTPTLSFHFGDGVPPGAPCLDGHFPGNPIVPGAMILAFLASRLSAQGLGIARVERMKFARPLRPGTPFDAVVTERATRARAEFRDADGVFAAAALALCRCHD